MPPFALSPVPVRFVSPKYKGLWWVGAFFDLLVPETELLQARALVRSPKSS